MSERGREEQGESRAAAFPYSLQRFGDLAEPTAGCRLHLVLSSTLGVILHAPWELLWMVLA